jgi:hypothetical protein
MRKKANQLRIIFKMSEQEQKIDATVHRSVYERFDMGEVPDYDATTEYRPVTLANHLDF